MLPCIIGGGVRFVRARSDSEMYAYNNSIYFDGK